MSENEFTTQVWPYLCELWPDWNANSTQGGAWFEICRPYTVAAARTAIKSLWHGNTRGFKTPDHAKLRDILASLSENRPSSAGQQAFAAMFHSLSRVGQAVVGAEICRRALTTRRFDRPSEQYRCEIELQQHEGLIRRFSARESDRFVQIERAALVELHRMESAMVCADERTE